MEFLNEYHLSGLFIGICTFLIIRVVSPCGSKGRVLLGYQVLVDFSCTGHRRRRSFTLCRKYPDCFPLRRICFFLVLDDQRSL